MERKSKLTDELIDLLKQRGEVRSQINEENSRHDAVIKKLERKSKRVEKRYQKLQESMEKK
jgi:chaperonin cofactor prefoldin